MKNYAKLIETIQKSELSLAESRKANFIVYVQNLETFQKASKIEQISICESIVKGTSLKVQTIRDNWAFLLKAVKLGISLKDFTSFNAVKQANKKVSSKDAKVTKAGKIVNDLKAQKAKKSEAEIIQATNENEILQLLQDTKFIEFKKSFLENDYKLANIMKALKQA